MYNDAWNYIFLKETLRVPVLRDSQTKCRESVSTAGEPALSGSGLLKEYTGYALIMTNATASFYIFSEVRGYCECIHGHMTDDGYDKAAALFVVKREQQAY